jgi:hypothetical protein
MQNLDSFRKYRLVNSTFLIVVIFWCIILVHGELNTNSSTNKFANLIENITDNNTNRNTNSTFRSKTFYNHKKKNATLKLKKGKVLKSMIKLNQNSTYFSSNQSFDNSSDFKLNVSNLSYPSILLLNDSTQAFSYFTADSKILMNLSNSSGSLVDFLKNVTKSNYELSTVNTTLMNNFTQSFNNFNKNRNIDTLNNSLQVNISDSFNNSFTYSLDSSTKKNLNDSNEYQKLTSDTTIRSITPFNISIILTTINSRNISENKKENQVANDSEDNYNDANNEDNENKDDEDHGERVDENDENDENEHNINDDNNQNNNNVYDNNNENNNNNDQFLNDNNQNKQNLNINPIRNEQLKQPVVPTGRTIKTLLIVKIIYRLLFLIKKTNMILLIMMKMNRLLDFLHIF